MKAAQWIVLGLLICLFVVHLVGVSAQGAGKKDKTSFGATGATGAAVADEPGTAANAGKNDDKKNKGSAKENVEVDSEKIKANKITSLKKLIEMYKKSDREGGQPSSMLRSLEKQLRNLEAGPVADSGEAAASGTDFDAQAEKMVAFRDIIRKDAQRVREEAVGPEDDDDSLLSSSDPESEYDEAVKARVAQGVQKLEEFKALPGVQEKNGIYFRRISEETEGKFATSRDRVHISVKASTMTGAVVYDSKKDTIVSKHVTMNRLRTRMFKLYELATFVREGETLEALLPPDIAGTMKRINKSNFYESIPSQSTILVELTVNQISVYKRDEL